MLLIDGASEHYSSILRSHGFARGVASPCQFFHEAWGVRLIVHGDDFIIVAKRAGREKTLKVLQSSFELKFNTAGPLQGMD